MSEGHARSLILTLATTGVATLLAFGINFFVTPFITERLGADAYGFINLANAFVSYAMIGTTAITSFATRYIGVEYINGRYEEASRYFSTVLVATAALTLLIFLGLVLVDANLSTLMNVPSGLLPDVQYLMVLVFANFLVVTASTCFSCSAYIENKLSVLGVFQSASYVVESAVLLLLYGSLGPQVSFFGVGLLAAGAVVLAGNLYIFTRYTPDLRFSFRYFDAGRLAGLVKNGIWNSVNQLGNALNSGLDLVVANLLLNPLAMGQVAISKTFSGVFSRLFQLVSTSFQPLFLESYSRGDEGGLKKELLVSMKMSGMVSNILFAGFFALCPAFYRLWIPSQDQGLLYALTMLTVACSAFEGPVNPLYYVYTLTVRNRVPCSVTVAGGVLNVLGMFLLIEHTSLGVYSIAITTTVIMGFINLVTNPIYISRCIGEKPLFFYPTLFRVLLSCLVMCGVFWAISAAVPLDTWVGFAACALVCAACGVLIHLLVALSREEKKALARRLFHRA